MIQRNLAIILLAALSLTGCATARQPREPSPDKPHLRVMTYNVNYGLAGEPTTLAAIAKGGADLVVLEETTPAWEALIRRTLADAYPHMAFRHCCGAGGLAVLSKYPIRSQKYLTPPQGGWFPGWRFVADTPLGPVQVLGVHLRPPVSEGGSVVSGYFTTSSVRRDQISDYWSTLDPALPTLVMGDFNEDVDGDAVQFLSAKGLRSVLPEFEPGADTWRWQTSLGQVNSRLDHIAYDRRRLVALSAHVVEAGRSDHLPVVATFERAEQPVELPEQTSGGSLSIGSI